ncbi:MAG: rhomboid family intramembrane serine protease [Nanoarchaeota archaeon]
MAVYQTYPKRKKNFFEGMGVNTSLVIINVFLFGVFTLLISLSTISIDAIAIKPSNILQGKYFWTFVTSMFMHAGFFHIFANMFSLFFIGNFLEKLIGGKRFFWLYLISGLVGGLFFVSSGLIFSNDSFGVGASGAIFGILGVLAVLVPYSKICLIAGPLLLIIAQVVLEKVLPASFATTLSLVINLLFLVMIFSIFSFNSNFRKISLPLELPMWLLPIIAIVPLVIIDFFVPLPIGNSAHLGGLVVGLIYGQYLKKKYPNKTKYISRVFSR